MVENVYKIADVPFKIESIYDMVHKISKDYLTNETPLFTITSTQQNIDKEREYSLLEHNGEDLFSDEYLESLSILRMLCNELIEYDTVLFHSSAVSFNNKAYLFTALSGTGKTTHIRLLNQYLNNKLIVINGDKPFIRIKDDKVIVYGSPWNGKENYGSNVSFELSSIIKINRSETNRIEKADLVSFYPTILEQVNRPYDDDKLKKTINLLDKIIYKAKFYNLYCNMELDAAKTSYEALIKD